jgi:hypothetical protein
MKKKFKMLMAYLKGFKKESIPFEITISETHIEEIEIYDDVNMTSTFYSYFETILELYTNELYDEGPGSVQSASDYFYVDGEIYPFENKIVFNQVRFTSYGTSDSGYEVYIDDYEEDDGMYSTFMEVRKFLEHEGIEDMTISYNGGGDSGYIESDYTSKNKNGQIDEDIEHICYDLLEEYGGWEINEGSQGNIVFTKDEISVNHEWNTEDDDSNEIDIEITEDSLP